MWRSFLATSDENDLYRREKDSLNAQPPVPEEGGLKKVQNDAGRIGDLS
jgi:hypothetical protein